MIHEVIWDGCRNGPGGAQLSTPEEIRRDASPRLVLSAEAARLRQRVLASLAVRPHTLRELAAALQITVERARDMVDYLKQDHHVYKCGTQEKHVNRGVWGGKAVEAVYGIVRREQ